MRVLLWVIAALFMCALGASPASAQGLDCSALPQSVCTNDEILVLEGERTALVEQLSKADPQNATLAGEPTWLAGLSACGEEIDCYRSAYANHNQTLRQSLPPPEAASEAAPEEPPDASTIETPPAQSEQPAQGRTRTRAEPRHTGPIYVPAGLPGWGFFTAFGVSFLILYLLLRMRERNQQALRAEEAAQRVAW